MAYKKYIHGKCKHILLEYTGFKEGCGKIEDYGLGLCLSCKTSIKINQDYQKMNLIKYLWKRKAANNSKR